MIRCALVVAWLCASYGNANADCPARVGKLRAVLEQARDAPRYWKHPAPTADKWVEIAPVGETILVTVEAAGAIRVDGAPTPAGRLRGALADAVRRARSYDDERRGVAIDVLADPASPARTIFTIASAAPRGVALRMIVARKQIEDRYAKAVIPAGAGAWVKPWLDGARQKTPAELSQHLQAGIKQAVGTKCPDLPLAFKKIGEANPGDIQHVFAKVIPDGLAACRCEGVDPAFEMIVALLHVGPPTHGALTVPKPPRKLPKTAADLAAELSSKL